MLREVVNRVIAIAKAPNSYGCLDGDLKNGFPTRDRRSQDQTKEGLFGPKVKVMFRTIFSQSRYDPNHCFSLLYSKIYVPILVLV